MDVQLWLAFVAASTALLLIPGPTVLLVLSYALSQGRTVALATVAGVSLGDLLAMCASLAGLGAVVMTSATVFTALKWLGAVYLVYLGIKLFRSASTASPNDLTQTSGASARKVFTHATIVTALNPKSIAFFIAFVPQFITQGNALLPQFMVLTGTFVGLAAINALAYALLADKLRRRIARPAVMAALSRFSGSALVVMGIATATLKRSSP